MGCPKNCVRALCNLFCPLWRRTDIHKLMFWSRPFRPCFPPDQWCPSPSNIDLSVLQFAGSVKLTRTTYLILVLGRIYFRGNQVKAVRGAKPSNAPLCRIQIWYQILHIARGSFDSFDLCFYLMNIHRLFSMRYRSSLRLPLVFLISNPTTFTLFIPPCLVCLFGSGRIVNFSISLNA